jgi:hypothetical protein
MVKVRKADPGLMDGKPMPPREMSPAARERAHQTRQFNRLISQLTGPDVVFEVRLDPTEKAFTVRQHILRVAADAGIEIAVRKHGEGFLVGLLTAERRAHLGRHRRPSLA